MRIGTASVIAVLGLAASASAFMPPAPRGTCRTEPRVCAVAMRWLGITRLLRRPHTPDESDRRNHPRSPSSQAARPR